VDGERLGRIHGLIHIQQRNILCATGQPASAGLASGGFHQAGLDNLARIRRTKLGLVFTLIAR